MLLFIVVIAEAVACRLSLHRPSGWTVTAMGFVKNPGGLENEKLEALGRIEAPAPAG